MNQTVPYLAGTSAERLNYEAGEEVSLPNDPSRRFTNYSVLGPESKTPDRLSPPTGNEPLAVPAPQFVGQWKVTASGSDGKTATLGFSVNPPRQGDRVPPAGDGPPRRCSSAARTDTSWRTRRRAWSRS